MSNQLTNEHFHNLYVLLGKTNEMIRKVRQNELNQYDIKIRQSAVLLAIKVIEAIGEDVTYTKISKLLLREPHTISRILTRMEKEGLVQKSRSPLNKNGFTVTLSEKGEQVYEQAEKRKSIREMMSCLSVEEFQQLYSALEKLLYEATSIYNKRRDNIPLYFKIDLTN